MIHGREFTRADVTGHTVTAVVNQRFVEQFGEGAEVLGRSLTVNSRTALTIVGVAPSVQQGRPDAPIPPRSICLSTSAPRRRLGTVRATGHLQAADVRRAISRLAPGVTMYDFAPADAIEREAIAMDRVYTLAASSFAAVSLLFAALGLAGLVSSAISARWSEFGVRCAFGAAAGSIHRSLARRAVVVVGAGLLLGVVAAVPGRAVRPVATERRDADVLTDWHRPRPAVPGGGTGRLSATAPRQAARSVRRPQVAVGAEARRPIQSQSWDGQIPLLGIARGSRRTGETRPSERVGRHARRAHLDEPGNARRKQLGARLFARAEGVRGHESRESAGLGHCSCTPVAACDSRLNRQARNAAPSDVRWLLASRWRSRDGSDCRSR